MKNLNPMEKIGIALSGILIVLICFSIWSNLPNGPDTRTKEGTAMAKTIKERCAKRYPEAYTEYEACTIGAQMFNAALPYGERL